MSLLMASRLARIQFAPQGSFKWVLRGFLLFLPGALLGLFSVPAHAAPVPVSVSIHPVALLVQAVGGEDVAVSTLLPPGASPHGFEPVPTQVRRLADARVLVTVGGGLDAWADRLAGGLPGDVERLVLMDSVGEPGHAEPHGGHEEHHEAHHGGHGSVGRHDDHGHDDHDDGHGHGHGDPHLWMDPVLVRDKLVPAIAGALAAADPSRAEAHRQRANAFQGRLTAMDAEFSKTLARVEGLAFVAFHGPWGRFAERYGMRQVAVVEPAPGRQPSARWMAQVVDTAREAGAKAMLIEPQFNPRVARTIADQFGGQVVTADPLGSPDTAATYEALMRNIRRSFQWTEHP